MQPRVEWWNNIRRKKVSKHYVREFLDLKVSTFTEAPLVSKFCGGIVTITNVKGISVKSTTKYHFVIESSYEFKAEFLKLGTEQY